MKKTSLYIEPEVDLALARLAEEAGKSKAAVIREALAEKAKSAPTQRRMTAIGVGHGPGDVADNVDRYLVETGFGED
ncbi:MAG: CopG family transcriptional regulator [Solirubrobacterales bacterium]